MRQLEGGIIIKIKTGLPDFDEEIHEKLLKDGWRELKEPKSLMGQVALSIPFMIINFIISQLIIGIFMNEISVTIEDTEDLKYAYLIILAISIVLIVVHELIHLLFIQTSLNQTIRT